MKAFQRAFFVPALTALALLSTAHAFADPPIDCSKALSSSDIRPRDSSFTMSFGEKCTIEGEITIREVDSKDKGNKREFHICERAPDGKLTYRLLSDHEVTAYVQCLSAEHLTISQTKRKHTSSKNKKKASKKRDNRPRDEKFDIPF